MAGFSGASGVPKKYVDDLVAQSTARIDYFSTDTGTVIRLDATDLNTIKRTGNYYANNNCPNSISGGGYLVVIEYSATYVKQIMYPYNDERTYTRSLNNGTWSGWIEQSTANRPYSVMVYFGTATSCVIEYTLPTSYNNANQILFYGRNGYSNAYGVIGVIMFSVTDESSIAVYKNGTGTVSASRSGNKITVTADAYSSLTFVSGYIPIKSA